MKDEEARLIWFDGTLRPIPRSERNIQVKIAKKIHAANRQKKNLYGGYKVLARASLVGKVSPTTSVIKVSIILKVRVRNWDIAESETRHEPDTELGLYIDRRPKIIQEKTLEPKVNDRKKTFWGKISWARTLSVQQTAW